MSAATASGADGRTTIAIIEQVRSSFAQTMAVLVMVLPFAGVIAAYGSGTDVASSSQLFIAGFTALAGGLALYFARTQRIGAAGVTITFVLTIAALMIAQHDVRLLVSLLAMMTSAMLVGRSVFIGTFVLLVIPPAYDTIIAFRETDSVQGGVAVETILSVATLSVVTIVFRYLYNTAQKTSDNAEQSYNRLASIAAVGRQTARLLRLEDVLNESVNLIKDQFGYYHVQIFLLDDRRENAVLMASTGEAGRRLLSREHKLGVGSQSVIGRATLANEPVLISDTENEPGHAFNPLLPETRAELALPMQVQTEEGNRVMGALDVQAQEPFAFSPTDVQALQALANQLAVAIRNAQLFESQETSLKENLRLYSDAHANLEEIQRLNRQLTRQAWEGYAESHTDTTGVMLEGETLTFNAGWTPLMIEAYHARDTITHKDDGVRVTATPIMLRDEVLGAVEVVGGNEEEINLIEAIVAFTERFAAALENVRLVEEAQAASAQEQRISAVVSRFQEAETVDELLQITLTELAETFDANGGSIRVGLSAGGQAAR